MWRQIERLLDEGVPLRKVSLKKLPGEKGWECITRLAAHGPRVYIKLQMRGGSRVLLRSFHLSRDER